VAAVSEAVPEVSVERVLVRAVVEAPRAWVVEVAAVSAVAVAVVAAAASVAVAVVVVVAVAEVVAAAVVEGGNSSLLDHSQYHLR